MNATALLHARRPIAAVLVTGFALATPHLAHSQARAPQGASSSHPMNVSPAPAFSLKRAVAHGTLAFEPNQGQTDKHVRFFTRGKGYSLFLTPTNAVFDFQEKPADKVPMAQINSKSTPVRHHVLGMQLEGAAQHPEISGVGPLPGKANYFIGNDPTKWHTGIATFDKVRYHSVYPGIDLLYYGTQKSLEYDFVVAPHHNPSQIAFRMQGARSLKVDGHGDLVIGLPKGEIRWHKPVVYQEIQGHRQSVAGRYRLNRNRISFAVANYDTNRPLVIDPQLAYSTILGGSNEDMGNAIATYTDSSTGKVYVYVTGTTASTDFPTTMGSYAGANTGQDDVFVTKMDLSWPGGSGSVLYSTYLGGSGEDRGNGIAVDSSGHAFVSGYTHAESSGTGFPTSSAFIGTNPADYTNGFITELSSSGSSLLYSTFITNFDTNSSTTESAYATGIAIDTSHSGHTYVYVTGTTSVPPSTMSTPRFPITTTNAYQMTLGGGGDAFVMKLDITLSGSAQAKYVSYLGGSRNDFGLAITADSSGKAYIAGNTQAPTGVMGWNAFPTTTNAYQSTFGGGTDTTTLYPDAFLAVFDTLSGSSLLYSTYLGTPGNEGGYGVAIDSQGYVYIAGFTNYTTTSSSGFPTTSNAIQRDYHGNTDSYGSAFLAKFDITQSTGANTLVYSTLFGSGTASTGGHDVATGLAVDAQGRAYLSGYSKGTIPHTSNAFQASNANTNTLDAFVAKIDPSLGSSGLLYSTFIGGTQDDAAKAIALDGAGLAYITGSTNSYDAQRNLPAQYPYPTTSTAFQGPRTSATYDDAFVSQVFTPSVTVSAPFDFNGDGSNDLLFQNSSGQVVAWYMQASVYVGGSFTSVDPASGYKLVGAGDINADGKPDLVFQNTSTGVVVIWYMNGVTYSSGATVSTTPASGYNVVGVGPFYGHSNPDLVFQNTSNGNVAIWYMSGASYSSGVTLSSTLPSGYTVAGCGHFGGTGGMDIVLQNTSTGAVTFWLLGGTSSSPTITTASLTGAATSLPSGYHIAAIADYNLDGQPDMVLQNGTSLLFYFMNGTVVTGIQAASASPASGYNVAGPH